MILQLIRLLVIFGVIFVVGSANYDLNLFSPKTLDEEILTPNIVLEIPDAISELDEDISEPEEPLIVVDEPNSSVGSEVDVAVEEEPIVISAITFTPTPIMDVILEVIPEISEVEIKSESIVGLNCFYKHKLTGTIFNTGRGSGVIINPVGFILTARHVVDFNFGLALGGGTNLDFELANESIFERCDVGIPPNNTSLPDANLIRSINPSTQLPVLGYTAELTDSLPSYAGKSYGEILTMDFTVLKISGISADGPTFGISNLPETFAYSQVLTEKPFPPIGDEILTYGFPGDTTAGKLATFNTLYLVGSVGVVDKIFSDGFIQTVMEISGGRSGSPLFWKGRITGVVTSYRLGNRTLSQSLSIDLMIDSIQKFLPR